MFEAKEHYGHRNIENLSQSLEWGHAIFGLLSELAYNPKNFIGVGRKSIFQRAIQEALDIEKEDEDFDEEDKLTKLVNRVERKYQKDQKESRVDGLYSLPKGKGPLFANEACRQLRVFHEIVLNSEFDLLMNLMPDTVITEYLNSYLQVGQVDGWERFPSCSELNGSIPTFTQPDSLLCSSSRKRLVAIELKLGAEVGEDQIEKYAALFWIFRDRGWLAEDCTFHLLILGTSSVFKKSVDELIYGARSNMKRPVPKESMQRPKKKKSDECDGRLAPIKEDILDILDNIDLNLATWSEFAKFLEQSKMQFKSDKLSRTYERLVDGFIWSLGEKRKVENKKSLSIID